MKNLKSFKIRKKNRWFIGRDISPAVEWADGSVKYCINGMIHREDGPVVEYAGDKKASYNNFRYY